MLGRTRFARTKKSRKGSAVRPARLRATNLLSTMLESSPPKSLFYVGTGMPGRFHNFMQYCELWHDTTAGGLSAYSYRQNSIYDPYDGAGGRSVAGIDELGAMYAQYFVIASAIEVQVTNSSSDPITLIVYPATYSGAATYTLATSAPSRKSVVISKETGMGMVKLHSRLTDFESYPLDQTAYGAATNANPTYCVYWKILLKNVPANALDCTIQVRILYDTLWSHRQGFDDTDA